MADTRLIRYVREELKKGYSPSTLRSTLVRYGYSVEDVDQAFREARSHTKALFVFGFVLFSVGLAIALFFVFREEKMQTASSIEVVARSFPTRSDNDPNFRSVEEIVNNSQPVPAPIVKPELASSVSTEDSALKEIVVLAAEDPQKARDLCLELLLRDQCLLEAGLNVHDVFFCGPIKSTDKRDTCYFNLALIGQDNLLCQEITDVHLKRTCAQI